MNAAAAVEYAFFQGNFVPFNEAKISIKTHAFLYGTAVFEGIRGYWVPQSNSISIFRLKEHYQRMVKNSRIFMLEPDYSVDELINITTQLIEKNAPNTDTYIRPTLYKGDVDMISPSLIKPKTEFCLWSAALDQYVDTEKGLKVCVSSWRRVDDNAIPPRTKAAGAYANTALVSTDARRMSFDDAIVLSNDGTVSEGSAMNLMMVRDGKLITPAKTDNILEGITRDAIITLARNELGLETEERCVDRTELYMMDEAFFCGTGAQVAPITSIDMRQVGEGEIGPITRQLKDLYQKAVRNQLPQYSHWCTMVPIDQSSPATSPVA